MKNLLQAIFLTLSTALLSLSCTAEKSQEEEVKSERGVLVSIVDDDRARKTLKSDDGELKECGKVNIQLSEFI